MLDSTISYVKEHPYQVGAIAVLGGIAAFVILTSGGGEAEVTGGYVSDGVMQTAQGNELAIASLQANVQTKAIEAKLSEAVRGFSASEFIASLQANAATTVAQLTAAANTFRIGAEKEVSLAQIGATSNVQIKNIEAGITSAQIAAGLSEAISNNSTLLTTKLVESMRPDLTYDQSAQKYLQDNPDVLAYYNSNKDWFAKTFGSAIDTPEEFASYHYQNFGKYEGAGRTPWTT